jgi:hypothetical protein
MVAAAWMPEADETPAKKKTGAREQRQQFINCSMYISIFTGDIILTKYS